MAQTQVKAELQRRISVIRIYTLNPTIQTLIDAFNSIDIDETEAFMDHTIEIILRNQSQMEEKKSLYN